jgi:hypothetical protein
MNVKDIITKISYDSSKPFIFIINSKTYSYYEVISDKELLNVKVNKINIEGKVHALTSQDIITYKDVEEFIVPHNAHYFLIVVEIK